MFTLMIISACLHILCSGSHRHEIAVAGCWCHVVWALRFLLLYNYLYHEWYQKSITASVNTAVIHCIKSIVIVYSTVIYFIADCCGTVVLLTCLRPLPAHIY